MSSVPGLDGPPSRQFPVSSRGARAPVTGCPLRSAAGSDSRSSAQRVQVGVLAPLWPWLLVPRRLLALHTGSHTPAPALHVPVHGLSHTCSHTDQAPSCCLRGLLRHREAVTAVTARPRPHTPPCPPGDKHSPGKDPGKERVPPSAGGSGAPWGTWCKVTLDSGVLGLWGTPPGRGGARVTGAQSAEWGAGPAKGRPTATGRCPSTTKAPEAGGLVTLWDLEHRFQGPGTWGAMPNLSERHVQQGHGPARGYPEDGAGDDVHSRHTCPTGQEGPLRLRTQEGTPCWPPTPVGSEPTPGPPGRGCRGDTC